MRCIVSYSCPFHVFFRHHFDPYFSVYPNNCVFSTSLYLYCFNGVVIDAVSCFTYSDISVLATINELKRDLKGRQIKLILAGRKTELTRWFKESRPTMKDDDMILAPDLYLALRFIQSKESMSEGESGVVE